MSELVSCYTHNMDSFSPIIPFSEARLSLGGLSNLLPPCTPGGRRISIASQVYDFQPQQQLHHHHEHDAHTDDMCQHDDTPASAWQDPVQPVVQHQVVVVAPAQATRSAADAAGSLQCPFFNCGYRCQFGSDIVRHLFGNKHAGAMRTMGPKLGYTCAECAAQGTDSVFMTYMSLNTHRRASHPPASYVSAEASLTADRVQKRKNREFIDLVTSMVERANRDDVVWLEDLVQGSVYSISRPASPVTTPFAS